MQKSDLYSDTDYKNQFWKESYFPTSNPYTNLDSLLEQFNSFYFWTGKEHEEHAIKERSPEEVATRLAQQDKEEQEKIAGKSILVVFLWLLYVTGELLGCICSGVLSCLPTSLLLSLCCVGRMSGVEASSTH